MHPCSQRTPESPVVSTYQRILVPIDGSEIGHRGLQEAIKLALTTRGSIRLIHVVDELRMEQSGEPRTGALDAPNPNVTRGNEVLAAGLAEVEHADVKGDVALRQGVVGEIYPAIALEIRAWDADMVVIGTHGRTGLPRLAFGSNAEDILHCSDVPVLQVRL